MCELSMMQWRACANTLMDLRVVKDVRGGISDKRNGMEMWVLVPEMN